MKIYYCKTDILPNDSLHICNWDDEQKKLVPDMKTPVAKQGQIVSKQMADMIIASHNNKIIGTKSYPSVFCDAYLRDVEKVRIPHAPHMAATIDFFYRPAKKE